jgi:hypothetical protein
VFRPRAGAALLLAAALWVFAARPAESDQSREIFQEIGRITAELARISGLQARRPVPYDLITKDKVNEFLNRRVKEVATPEEIRAEQLTLRKFGLVPADFDLARATVDLKTEQAAAFYDFKKKKLFITDTTPSSNREAALVHELAHALADQNFNLDKFMKKAGKSDDGALARMAVMEGQATWLMSEYLARRMGQSLETSPSLADSMARSTEVAEGQFPVFDGSPLYMRETLIFPYGKGMAFQQAVVKRDGESAFAEVFRRAPVSTQQVLHPERYFEGAVPARAELPPFRARGYKALIEGSFGELDHAILLQQFAGKEEAREIAPLWRGGQYRIYENRAKTRSVLVYASRWDSPEAAQRFFAFYRRALQKKWKRFEPVSETPGRVAGAGDDGYFVLEATGPAVTSIEGAETPLVN